jgi:hypothetical protein
MNQGSAGQDRARRVDQSSKCGQWEYKEGRWFVDGKMEERSLVRG